YMACVIARLPIETVPPMTWKKLLSVPGKAKNEKAGERDRQIVARADEILPDYRRMWRGPKGGILVDRAEAAMLAYFGLVHVLRTVQEPLKNRSDAEYRLAYRNADTGA
ncbi:hypothetical protein, partial [Tepidimonas sp.]|uniref:hypothetical protein n=1 Tax=Tepidimonas sp. TaxID=2002775 RepID=UPI00391A751C